MNSCTMCRCIYLEVWGADRSSSLSRRQGRQQRYAVMKKQTLGLDPKSPAASTTC